MVLTNLYPIRCHKDIEFKNLHLLRRHQGITLTNPHFTIPQRETQSHSNNTWLPQVVRFYIKVASNFQSLIQHRYTCSTLQLPIMLYIPICYLGYPIYFTGQVPSDKMLWMRTLATWPFDKRPTRYTQLAEHQQNTELDHITRLWC